MAMTLDGLDTTGNPRPEGALDPKEAALVLVTGFYCYAPIYQDASGGPVECVGMIPHHPELALFQRHFIAVCDYAGISVDERSSLLEEALHRLNGVYDFVHRFCDAREHQTDRLMSLIIVGD